MINCLCEPRYFSLASPGELMLSIWTQIYVTPHLRLINPKSKNVRHSVLVSLGGGIMDCLSRAMVKHKNVWPSWELYLFIVSQQLATVRGPDSTKAVPQGAVTEKDRKDRARQHLTARHMKKSEQREEKIAASSRGEKKKKVIRFSHWESLARPWSVTR